jgi:hypothetical protein
VLRVPAEGEDAGAGGMVPTEPAAAREQRRHGVQLCVASGVRGDWLLLPIQETMTPQPALTNHELAEHVAKTLGFTESASVGFLKQAFECAKVFDSKMHDYGPNNIAAFMDYGCLVRISDKIARLKNLYASPATNTVPKHESIDDSFLDISNYGNIALMCRRGVWPK